MKTKKIAAVLLTCIVAIGLMAGCGASNTNKSASNNDSQSTSTNQSENEEADTNSENTTDTTENTSTGNGKTLVVYYSASGNTKDVAEKIAKITEADLFEIEPVEPYTDDDLDWTDDDSRVSREHDDESLRDVELVSTTVDNWESYDTVYIGYPIWWGIAAWPVDTFVKGNDFTGKTVIPFCTSTSSGLGDSGTRLQKLAGTGNWQAGQRFSSGASASEVSKWVKSLKLGN